ncbi:alpha/beta hydrolase [Lactococcus sp.]|uniref:alpha/beta hydrolase n=1 Tax=Lactococcus sp. TaxID=44273 RepID=UPI002FC75CEE
MKKKKLKIILSYIGAIFLVIIGLSFFYIKTNSYQPSSKALSFSQKSETQGSTLVFKGNPEKTSVIFYQGALVDNRSYSIWASKLASNGYTVYLLKEPFNLAILNPNQASSVIKANKLKNYVVGGHSLGGVIASRFAKKSETDSSLKGIFFLASYPDKKGNLNNFKGEVLSIVGTQDNILNWSSYKKAKQYLPKETSYVTIEGGNHGGFGSYGSQKGDKKAKISNNQQQEEISQTLIDWLDKVN